MTNDQLERKTIMSNEVINKTSEGGMTLNTYKIVYDGMIYYYKEIIDRYGEMVDGLIYDEDGHVVMEPDFFENLMEVINKTGK